MDTAVLKRRTLALSAVRATGLAAQTRIVGSETDVDTLRIPTLGGNDSVTVSPSVFPLIVPVIGLVADE